MRQTCQLNIISRKASFLLLLLFSFTGCISVTSAVSSLGGCRITFAPGEKVLMGEAGGVSANHSYKLYEAFEQQVREAGLQPAYVVEQDIDLRLHGINPNAAIDTGNLAKMQQLGYDYFLKPTIGNLATGLGYYSYSAEEVRQMDQADSTQEQDEETKATLQFDLYSTHTRKIVYSLTTTSKMHGIPLPNKDEENGYSGRTTVNASTDLMAIDKALKKGTKRLLENCHCCREQQ